MPKVTQMYLWVQIGTCRCQKMTIDDYSRLLSVFVTGSPRAMPRFLKLFSSVGHECYAHAFVDRRIREGEGDGEREGVVHFLSGGATLIHYPDSCCRPDYIELPD